MRFGAFVPQGWRLDLVDVAPDRHWETMKGLALEIEAAGLESAWVYDHFHTVPIATLEPTYEAWTLMAALSAVTSTVRLGQMCTANSYRMPSYLAKVAASIDVISNGRVEMGIGAGWYEAEYLGFGYQFPRPAVRIGQLEEGVQIMKLMWTEDSVDFEGKHYRLRGGICRPRPVQQPHIPLWVAGGGEQLTLRTAARHAAYTNFGADLEQFVRKAEILAEHCRDLGRDPAEIVRSSNFNIVCAATEAEVEDTLDRLTSRYRAFGVPEARIQSELDLIRPYCGTPEQVVAMLTEWQAAGLDYAIVYFPDLADDPGGLRLFAEQVIPALG